jgi:pimeloyl-ACP methyl ester carboxylesterase
MSSRVLSRCTAAVRRHRYLVPASCLGLVAGLVVAVTAASGPAAARAASPLAPRASVAKWDTPPNATCATVTVPVSLLPGAPKSYRIAGELCRPSGTAPSTVQILLSGATYDRYYWNPPGQPQYSYVRAATAAGYATLDIDPLGTGLSSKPLSALVTVPSTAYTVHQVIQAARSGALGTAAFTHVVLSSHSMGAAVAWNEIANYHDVDGLIAADNVHIPWLVGAVAGSLTLYPAMLDPKFLGKILDPGYLTTRPGTRAASFFYNGDPAVIAQDEKLKQIISATFLATYFLEDVNLDTARIHVPVLIAAGQHDSLMCAPLLGTNCSSASTLLSAEAPFYAPATCLQGYVLPGAGHDINLSSGASDFFDVTAHWLDRWIGTTGQKVSTQQCTGPVGPAS